MPPAERPSLPPWLDGLSHRDFLFDGGPCSAERWAELDWSDAYVDMGPSPMGNPGPYWHVPHYTGETVHRLYPKVLRTKWLPLIREAIAKRESQATAACKGAPDLQRVLSLLVTLIRMDTPRERLETTLAEAEAALEKSRAIAEQTNG